MNQSPTAKAISATNQLRGRIRASASVIIPAHNEAMVIASCLRELWTGIDSGEFDVVVACNGCSDDTASIARAFPGVTVLELETPSKAAALRAADAALTLALAPRIYLDSDVVLPLGAARAIVSTLSDGTALACRPRIRYDSSDASWPVRSYYAARRRLPSVMSSLWGAGIYALSAEGRTRFEHFPDVVADDLWIDSLYSRNEISICGGPPVTVVTPRRAADLLRILCRAQRGKREADVGVVPAGQRRGSTAVRSELLELARRGPGHVVDAAVYVAFAIAARFASRSSTSRWERDESSRQPR